MANTERMALLAEARTAGNDLRERLEDDTLTPKERRLMEKSVAALDKLEDTLILEDLDTSAAALRRSSASLGGIVADMRKEEASIKKIADTIDKIATAVKQLANVAAALAKFGV